MTVYLTAQKTTLKVMQGMYAV